MLRQLDIGRNSVFEEVAEGDVEPGLVGRRRQRELLVDRRGRGDPDDRAETFVGVYDAAFRVDLQDADRQRLGQPAQELFARAQCFDRVHPIGDVDHLRDHQAARRIGQPVFAARLQPHVRSVATAMSQDRVLTQSGPGQHFHPVGDGLRPIVGVNQIEGTGSDQLLAAAP
jgi:hypothetical protein